MNSFEAMKKAHRAFLGLPESVKSEPWPGGFWSIVANFNDSWVQIALVNRTTRELIPTKEGRKYLNPKKVAYIRRN